MISTTLDVVLSTFNSQLSRQLLNKCSTRHVVRCSELLWSGSLYWGMGMNQRTGASLDFVRDFYFILGFASTGQLHFQLDIVIICAMIPIFPTNEPHLFIRDFLVSYNLAIVFHASKAKKKKKKVYISVDLKNYYRIEY